MVSIEFSTVWHIVNVYVTLKGWKERLKDVKQTSVNNNRVKSRTLWSLEPLQLNMQLLLLLLLLLVRVRAFGIELLVNTVFPFVYAIRYASNSIDVASSEEGRGERRRRRKRRGGRGCYYSLFDQWLNEWIGHYLPTHLLLPHRKSESHEKVMGTLHGREKSSCVYGEQVNQIDFHRQISRCLNKREERTKRKERESQIEFSPIHIMTTG